MLGQATERWSVLLGEWRETELRWHASLLMTLVVVIGATAHSAPLAGGILMAVILISAALHEAAHQAVASRLHGGPNSIVLTPIGGLRLPSAPNDPELLLLVGMVGPLVNLSIVVLAAGALAYSTDSLEGVFTLAAPAGLLSGPWYEVALKSALWVNWLTFLVSLIPTYPFDGSSALRAALWPLFGQRSAEVFCAQAARVMGLGLLVAGIAVLQTLPDQALTLAVPLGALAMLVLCGSQHDLEVTTNTSSVPLGGYMDSLPQPVAARRTPSDHGLVLEEAVEDHWRGAALDPLEEEASQDAAVDAILERLHTHGPGDLSAEDRRVLERAGRRYRQRRGDRPSSG